MISAFFLVAMLFIMIYMLLISILINGWNKTKTIKNNIGQVPEISVSVIIAVRNEECNLPVLLSGLANQDYNRELVQWIFVNDHSSDSSFDILQIQKKLHHHLVLINLGEDRNGKKMALQMGIKASTGQLLVFTDADCLHPPGWISGLVWAYKTWGDGLVLAPVEISPVKNALSLFQAFEFFSLMMATAATTYYSRPGLANGANLSYPSRYKALALKAMESPSCSGDDMFFLKLCKENKIPVRFLKSNNCIVETKPQESWYLLLMQRMRWAHKNKYFGFSVSNVAGVVVYAANSMVLATFLLSCFIPSTLMFAIGLFVIKLFADFAMLYRGSAFFGLKKYLWAVPFLEIMLLAFYFISGLAVLFPRFSWKGRKFR